MPYARICRAPYRDFLYCTISLVISKNALAVWILVTCRAAWLPVPVFDLVFANCLESLLVPPRCSREMPSQSRMLNQCSASCSIMILVQPCSDVPLIGNSCSVTCPFVRHLQILWCNDSHIFSIRKWRLKLASACCTAMQACRKMSTYAARARGTVTRRCRGPFPPHKSSTCPQISGL